MKAVILAGGLDFPKCPLDLVLPRALFPLAGRAAIRHVIAFLRGFGADALAVCANGKTTRIRDYLQSQHDLDVPVHYSEDRHPRGPAGCLKDVAALLGTGPFVAVSGDMLLDFDLRLALEAHRRGGASVTMVVGAPPRAASPCEVRLRPGTRQVESVRRHFDRNIDPSQLSPWNCFIMDPACLAYVPERGFCDIKEQLIPALQADGRLVEAFVPSGRCARVGPFSEYLKLHGEAMLGTWPVRDGLRGYRQRGPNVWVHPSAKVEAGARLMGPVVVGRGARVSARAYLQGPVAVGHGSRIDAGARVCRSVIWDDATIASGADVDGCVVANRAEVQLNSCLRGASVLASRAIRGHRVSRAPVADPEATTETGHTARPRRLRAYQAIKRALDILGAAVGLLITVPLYPFIALAIKLNSRGPVFYGQRRQCQGGRPFTCLKFRTMSDGADQMRAQIGNDVDGPQFKLRNDPRITRVGRLLRKTNLDEIPQLWNVLLGQMSLVGPRPLPPDENAICREWREARLSMKPGLTGLWQVRRSPCRGEGDFQEWIRYDMQYYWERSVTVDLAIISETFVEVGRQMARLVLPPRTTRLTHAARTGSADPHRARLIN